MTFKFTGETPALLSHRATFSTFSQLNVLHSVHTDKIAPTQSLGVEFGRSSMLGGETRDRLDVPRSTQTRAALPSHSASEENTAFHRALDRAEKSRRAVIGRKEIAGDNILERHLKGIDVPALRVALRNAAPAVARLAQSLFDELVGHATQAPLAATSIAHRAKWSTIKDSCYIHEAPEVGRLVLSLFGELDEQILPAPAERTSICFTQQASSAMESNQITREMDGPIPNAGDMLIPRDHVRIEEYEYALTDALFKFNFVHHEEGAHVLAVFIVDEIYRGVHPHTVNQTLMDTLGWSTSRRTDPLIDTVAKEVWNLDDRYRNGKFDERRGDKRCDLSNHHRQGIGIFSKLYKQASAKRMHCQLPAQTNNKESQQVHFCFLDLPPEMRNRIYINLLAPTGSIILSRFDFLSSEPRNVFRSEPDYTVVSGCELPILRTCKQVYKEGKSILYRENTVNIKVDVDAYSACCINHGLLPSATLPLLASMTLVLDFQGDQEHNNAWIDRVNWVQLQALTTLKELRICLVESGDLYNWDDHKRMILKNVMERIPADCKLSYESNAICEIDLAQEVVEEHDALYSRRGLPDNAYEVDGEVLKRLAGEVLSKQGFEPGCKNGHARNYRFAPRALSVAKSVEQLIVEGAVDPAIVLGGPR